MEYRYKRPAYDEEVETEEGKKETIHHEAVDEAVDLERWCWGVVYQDGEEFKQFGDDGVFHRVGEIDQDKVAMAVLIKPGEQTRRIDIPWKKGARLIHLYRHFIFAAGTPEERREKVYIFGYRDGDICSVAFVLPDDRVVMTDDQNYDIMKHDI